MKKVFIPFREGLLDYDCRRCGGRCCREPGIIVATEEERKVLLAENPFLTFFIISEEKKRYTFRRHPHCWFLENNGSCEIQRKHGYSLKPFICRIDPFYVVKCADEYVVVRSGCDMMSVTKRGSVSTISNEVVLTNAQEAIAGDYFNGELSWSPEKLFLEKSVLEESGKFLDRANYMDFAAFQMAAATRNEDLSGIRTQFGEIVDLWKRFLGVEDLEIENRTLTYELTAMTSLLRVSNQNLQHMEGNRIPVTLLALYFCMLLFSHGRRGERFVGTFESVLADIAMGLGYLSDGDLRIRNQSLEKKVRYLRTLGRIYFPGFMGLFKTKGPSTGGGGI